METKEPIRQKMWRAMRVMKTFSILELQITAKDYDGDILSEHTVKNYCMFLARAGYLAKLHNNYFKVVKFSGPVAPMVINERQSPSLLDPNTEEEIPLQILRTSVNKEKVLTVISFVEEFNIEELIAKTNLCENSIRTVIKKMIKSGEVEKIRTEKRGMTRMGIYRFVGNK